VSLIRQSISIAFKRKLERDEFKINHQTNKKSVVLSSASKLHFCVATGWLELALD
jgi:hypothetical protein